MPLKKGDKREPVNTFLRRCSRCGEVFGAARHLPTPTRYCSTRCRVAAHRDKKRLGAAVVPPSDAQ